MTTWYELSVATCKSLEEYNKMFSQARLPMESYTEVPLTEWLERYCCGLPKEICDYCTKTKVTNMSLKSARNVPKRETKYATIDHNLIARQGNKKMIGC